MSNIVHDATQKRNEVREYIVSMRAKYEQQVEDWRNSLTKTSKTLVQDKIDFDFSELTLRTLVPEWYEQTPNPEVWKQQVTEANAKFDHVNNIIQELNEQQYKVYEEFLAAEVQRKSS